MKGVTPEMVADWERKGLIPPPPAPPERTAKLRHVEPGFGLTLTLSVPVEVVSESNAREWRARSLRTQKQRAAVSRALSRCGAAVAVFAAAVQGGRPVRVTLTRLGGRRLDPPNLPAAFKAVIDALAAWLGVDDRSELYRWDFAQEPGGADGVRVVLETVGD